MLWGSPGFRVGNCEERQTDQVMKSGNFSFRSVAEADTWGSLDAAVNRDSKEYLKSESYYDYILQTFVSPSLPARCNVNNCRELDCEDFKTAKNMTKDRARQVYFISLCVQNIFVMTQAMHVRRFSVESLTTQACVKADHQ